MYGCFLLRLGVVCWFLISIAKRIICSWCNRSYKMNFSEQSLGTFELICFFERGMRNLQIDLNELAVCNPSF
jgi:hypothetical protein